MAASTTRKKPVAMLVVTGIFSIIMYAALLSQQDLVLKLCGKGGLNAFLPIITAFAFSIIHGTFTGHFWTVLGFEAAKRKKEGH